MALPLVQVDAFTDVAFAGNPAAVCVLPEPRDPDWMQHVAREMNLSETAFLHRNRDSFHLRWFTPTVEVALCGHATLASAHVLWEEGYLPKEETARFQTKSGLLMANRRGGEIEMGRKGRRVKGGPDGVEQRQRPGSREQPDRCRRNEPDQPI